MDKNIDFSGSDQIQTPQYLDIHTPSQEISDEVFHAKGDLMKSIETFLEKFNCIPFEEKPPILLQAWDCSNFLNDNEDHSDQNKESLENSSTEIVVSNSNQEKEGPSQESDIRQLIREECCVEASEEQKQNMEDTILELEVENVVEQPAERGNCIEKSLQNFRVMHKSSVSLKITSQISPVHAIAPILSTKEPEYSPSMGYEHSNTTLKTKLDEIIKSGVEELVPILSENEVTLEDKMECDMPICENSPVCDDHSEIFFDSKNDDDISSDDEDFEDVKYVEASLSDPEIVNVEEDNVVQQEEEENLKLFAIIRKRREVKRLINVMKNDILDDSRDPLLEEVDLFLASDNSIPPGIENFDDDSEVDVYFLEELLIDDSILFPNNESSESENNPSVPLPPPKPPDAETDAGEEIPVVMNDKDKFDEDYYFSCFIRVHPSSIEVSCVRIFVPIQRSSYPLIEISLGKSISFDQYCLAVICRLYA
nr:hypothetical protein [Tanacetum cinerariifolium]